MPDLRNIVSRPIRPPGRSIVEDKAAFYEFIRASRTAILGAQGSHTPKLQQAARQLVLFYRLRITALAARADFASVQETVEDYNSVMKCVSDAAQFDKSFNLLVISDEQAKELEAAFFDMPKYPHSDELSSQRKRVASNGLLLGLEKYFPETPFAEEPERQEDV